MSEQHLSVEADLSVIKEQLREVENLSQGVRLLAVYQFKSGREIEELAQFYKVSSESIYEWIKAYEEKGLDGLNDKWHKNEFYPFVESKFSANTIAEVEHEFEVSQQNRPEKINSQSSEKKENHRLKKRISKKNLDDTQREALKIVINDTPRNYGYEAEIWTVPLIMDYIEHAFGLSYIKPQVCHILRSLGLPIRRAKAAQRRTCREQNKAKSLKSSLDENRMTMLKSAIADTPRKSGYEADNWTISLLKDFVKREFGISCGNTRVNKLVREMGISLRRKKGIFLEPDGKGVISRENLDKTQKALLKEAVTRSPRNYGYAEKEWNILMVVDYIENTFGRTYMKPQACHLLRSMGLSVRREPNASSEK
ncbi:MAG: helix-turn-helix domain-containing protein [Prevotellaceae bacterium]|jgi:transposase|nr:helix-turn-helix domain-containing protein [Prevotellaceae bacterium]